MSLILHKSMFYEKTKKRQALLVGPAFTERVLIYLEG